ncbi:MAG: LacI family DNA-binding transcriptional regulator [bacterium]
MNSPLHQVTMKDVARFCGVGGSTVQRALSDDPRVKASTKKRILAAAQELGYNPAHHEAARRMVLRRQGRDITNYTVGLLMPLAFEEVPYFFRIFQGLINIFASKGYAVVTFSFGTDFHPNPVSLPSVFFRGEIDGLILIGHPKDTMPFITQLRNDSGFGPQRPMISMINIIPEIGSVTTDDVSGAYEATKHLLDLGHKNILQLTLFNFGKLDERQKGITKALLDAGLSPEKHLHFLEMSDYKETEGWLEPATLTDVSRYVSSYQSINKDFSHPLLDVLKKNPETSAILALNDACAIQAWSVLQQAGLKVPDDISIIGFDDVEQSITLDGQLGLTTVRLPLVDIGRSAAEHMIAAIQSHNPSHEMISLPTQLIVRSTTSSAKNDTIALHQK